LNGTSQVNHATNNYNKRNIQSSKLIVVNLAQASNSRSGEGIPRSSYQLSLGRVFEQWAPRVLTQANPYRSSEIALAQARDLRSGNHLKQRRGSHCYSPLGEMLLA